MKKTLYLLHQVNCQPCYTKYKAAQCVRCNKGIVSTGETKTSLVTCQVCQNLWDCCKSSQNRLILYLPENCVNCIPKRPIWKTLFFRARATTSSATPAQIAASLWAASLSALRPMMRLSALDVTPRGKARNVIDGETLRNSFCNKYQVKVVLSVLLLDMGEAIYVSHWSSCHFLFLWK